jgi:hypothetical protein
MFSWKIQYQWFKLIKTKEVSAKTYSDAIKEFLSKNSLPKQYILTCKKIV